MPATRLANRRRRSSHAIFTPARAGNYGVGSSNSAYSSPSPAPPPYSQLPMPGHGLQARPVTFAPNVTPVTFNEEDSEDDGLASLAASTNPNVQALTAKLFPPSATPAPPPQRKRCPPGKRLSQGYIPRPPNAFMLFRADFVRQKHVPGSIETDHGSLSKIIGTCWRQLPLEEKRVWEVKAKQEKAAHKAKYPDYRFRPVHNKKKQAVPGSPEYESLNQKQQQTPEEAQRCDDIAQLLLEGKKGEELARAARDLERLRARAMENNGAGNAYADYSNGFGDRRQSFNPNFAMPMPMSNSSSSLLQVPFTAPFAHGAMNPHHHQHHAAYHRRSSSVPLPNEWIAFTHAQTHQLNQNHGGGITLPSIPPFASSSSSNLNHHDGQSRYEQPEEESGVFEQFTNPFLTQYAGPSTSANDHQGNQHQPDNLHPHHNLNAPNSNFQFPLFAPQPQFAGLSTSFFNAGNGMNITPRNSYGHRRASSAQPILRRSWTMDDTFGGYGFAGANGMMERDPEPLPEVNTEFFASDFSFTSPSTAASAVSGGVGSASVTGVDERGLAMGSASAVGSMTGGIGADLDLVDPATPLSAIHPRIQPPHHSHSHSQNHTHSLSLSGIDTALAGVSFSSSNNSSAGASSLLSTSSVSVSAHASPAASSTTIDSPAPQSLSDAVDGLPISNDSSNSRQFVDPNAAYNMNSYVQYGQQQQPDELAMYTASGGPEHTPAVGTAPNNNSIGAGDVSGVESYPASFGSPYDLQSYDQHQQHLHGMIVSQDGANGDATVMYDHGHSAYEVAQNGHGLADDYLEYDLGLTTTQHQPQIGMGMHMGVGVSSGGYYDGVSA